MQISSCSTSCGNKSATRSESARSSPSAHSLTSGRGSTRITCTARRWLLHDRAPRPRDRRSRLQMSEPQAVEEFLVHLEKERDVSPNTLIAYRRDLEEFVSFLGRYYGADEWSWQGLDRLAIRGFLAHLTRKKLNKRSIARNLSAVRSFYKYLHREEQVEANPARGVTTPKQDKYLPSYLDRAQIELLFQSAELKAQEGRFGDVRNCAILELFYSTPARIYARCRSCSATRRSRRPRSTRTRASSDSKRSIRRLTPGHDSVQISRHGGGMAKKRHHWIVRVTHWVNVVAIIIMVGS